MPRIFRYTSGRIDQLRAVGKFTMRLRFSNWNPLTLVELYGFLAIVFNMGIIRLPELENIVGGYDSLLFSSNGS